MLCFSRACGPYVNCRERERERERESRWGAPFGTCIFSVATVIVRGGCAPSWFVAATRKPPIVDGFGVVVSKPPWHPNPPCMCARDPLLRITDADFAAVMAFLGEGETPPRGRRPRLDAPGLSAPAAEALVSTLRRRTWRMRRRRRLKPPLDGLPCIPRRMAALSISAPPSFCTSFRVPWRSPFVPSNLKPSFMQMTQGGHPIPK